MSRKKKSEKIQVCDESFIDLSREPRIAVEFKEDIDKAGRFFQTPRVVLEINIHDQDAISKY